MISYQSMRRILGLIILVIIVQCFLTESVFGQVFPYPPPEGQLRIVIWNIEFLGRRDPLRTQQQLDLLAERMAGFEAAIFALQEIVNLSTLAYVANQMGPEWNYVDCDAMDNALLYNIEKVELLETEYWDTMGLEEYPEYPGDPWRAPIYGLFRQKNTKDIDFSVIGVHFHWQNPDTRINEGRAVRMKIDELLASQKGRGNIILCGDLNYMPETDAHPELLKDGLLHRFPKANGESTYVSGNYEIDHFFINTQAVNRVPQETAYVIRPEHYNETNVEFEETYSDHLPVFIDYIPNMDYDLPTAPHDLKIIEY